MIKFILAWILGAFVVHRNLRLKLREEKRKLFGLCITYIVALGVFGHVYQQLYKGNHERFAFASDIARTRQLASEADVANEKQMLADVLSALDEISAEMLNAHAQISEDDRNVYVDTTNYQWTFGFNAMWSVDHKGELFLEGRLHLLDRSGKQLVAEPFSIKGPGADLKAKLSEYQWAALLDTFFPPNIDIKTRSVELLAPLRSRIQISLRERSNQGFLASTDQWTYLDFFYFSTITQTTVGYGDILPNNSIVRVVVILQILVGLFLIGIGVSWFTNGAKSNADDSVSHPERPPSS